VGLSAIVARICFTCQNIFQEKKRGGLSPWPHGPVTPSVYHGLGTEGCQWAHQKGAARSLRSIESCRGSTGMMRSLPGT
jgi:uncharacterized phage-associated protein